MTNTIKVEIAVGTLSPPPSLEPLCASGSRRLCQDQPWEAAAPLSIFLGKHLTAPCLYVSMYEKA